MRKVILGLAVSLDGFIEGPNGEYDWCFTDQDYGLSEFFKRIDAIAMGRKSYELAQSTGGPDGEDNPWKGIKTYVFSNTLKSITAKDTELISGDAASEIRKLKAQPGKDIWLFGGAELTASLLDASVVDELWLSIHPVVLGSGKPLFQNVKERLNLRLIEHKVYETGLVSVCYAPM